MTASAASPNGHRLLAVIAPGAGPHLIGPPAASHWTTRPARSRVSLADELANCLTMLEEDPERFQCAAASWHARWCIDLATLTLDRELRRRSRRSRRSPALEAPRPQASSDTCACSTASARRPRCSSAGSRSGKGGAAAAG